MSSGTRAATKWQRRGFSLLELIVVIAIIATLASLVAPSVFRNAGDAKVAAARSQISSIALALDTYRIDTGDYPREGDGLQVLVRDPGGGGWRGPYLRRGLPRDPWGNEYVYRRNAAAGDDFALVSHGRDGRPGGSGEDADISSADTGAAR